MPHRAKLYRAFFETGPDWSSQQSESSLNQVSHQPSHLSSSHFHHQNWIPSEAILEKQLTAEACDSNPFKTIAKFLLFFQGYSFSQRGLIYTYTLSASQVTCQRLTTVQDLAPQEAPLTKPAERTEHLARWPRPMFILILAS